LAKRGGMVACFRKGQATTCRIDSTRLNGQAILRFQLDILIRADNDPLNRSYFRLQQPSKLVFKMKLATMHDRQDADIHKQTSFPLLRISRD